MFRIGLSSSALLHKTPDEVVAFAHEAGFDGIEWTGAPHLPAGDRSRADEVMMATLRGRLTIASYAPLYRVLPGGGAGIAFSSILATALAINAPIIRIYAGGGKTAMPAPASARTEVLDELRRLGDEAGAKGIALALSPGPRTLMETWTEAARLIADLGHPFVRLAWEPIRVAVADEGAALVEKDPSAFLLVHARDLDRDGLTRPLADRGEAWTRIFRAFAAKPGSRDIGCFALLGGIGDTDDRGLESLAADLAFARTAVPAPARGTGA